MKGYSGKESGDCVERTQLLLQVQQPGGHHGSEGERGEGVQDL